MPPARPPGADGVLTGRAQKGRAEDLTGGAETPVPTRSPLPILQHNYRTATPLLYDLAPKATIEAAPHGSGYSALPAALDAALEDPLSLLALEDWHKTHHERAGDVEHYESRLLACEARLRKLDHLSLRLRAPSAVVAAVVVDLLKRVFATLPPALNSTCSRLMQIIEGSVYSEEKATGSELQQLQEVLGHPIPKVPHFVIVRRQQVELERLEARAAELQLVVDEHMERRRGVLEFITRLQKAERTVLQQWLFQFWVTTFQNRKFRIQKMASAVLSGPVDIVTPFVSWRLYVSQMRLERARAECEAMDKEASMVANRITEVEIENEEQQKKLQISMEASSALKAQCQEEQQEHQRLQQLWETTQPELLLAVLAQSLEFLFGLVMRAARFTGLQLRQRLAGKDVRPLLEGGTLAVSEVSAEQMLVVWVNRGLERARVAADKLLQQPMPTPMHQTPAGSPTAPATSAAAAAAAAAALRARLETVRQMADIRNFGEDVADSAALCALFAVLRAEKEGGTMAVQDLWPLDERDADLRAEQLFSTLRAFALTPRARCILSPVDIVTGNSVPISIFLACAFLQEPLLPDLPPDMSPEEQLASRQQLDEVLSKLEQLAGPVASEPPDDPTPLLHGGEDQQALATTSTEQLLLRWVNVQLQSVFTRPVENFGSDLQDGEALAMLLSVIAPEVVMEDFSTDPEERLDQVVAAAARCTDFELLTAAAVSEGQSDMLAAFLAQLFLSRPNLAARPDSLLAMHLRLLERVCSEGTKTLINPSDSSQVLKMCVKLDAQWPEFTLAAQTVHEAGKTMQGINDRMRTFLGDTLAHRAQGRPRVMLDAKEAREFLLYTSLNVEKMHSMMQKEAIDAGMIGRIEELLRKHFRMLRDIFRRYAVPAAPGANGTGVALEGLMKFYQDCKLRSRDLAPHHLEVIFCDHLDTSTSERILSPQAFIEVLLQCANLKFRERIDNVPEQLQYLIEHHLKPHAFQDTENIFQRMAYDPKVREVLDKHSKELKIIFALYATMDTSTTDAMQRVSTMNIKEFHMLLSHCDMLDETLTESAMEQIFSGIQQSATDEATNPEGTPAPVPGAEEVGIDDDEELALTEFLDGLVAVAAYKFPDPFTPFHTRVNAFILKLFAAMRRHWSRKRVSPQVDAMLNALQKKLR